MWHSKDTNKNNYQQPIIIHWCTSPTLYKFHRICSHYRKSNTEKKVEKSGIKVFRPPLKVLHVCICWVCCRMLIVHMHNKENGNCSFKHSFIVLLLVKSFLGCFHLFDQVQITRPVCKRSPWFGFFPHREIVAKCITSDHAGLLSMLICQMFH